MKTLWISAGGGSTVETILNQFSVFSITNDEEPFESLSGIVNFDIRKYSMDSCESFKYYKVEVNSRRHIIKVLECLTYKEAMRIIKLDSL